MMRGDGREIGFPIERPNVLGQTAHGNQVSALASAGDETMH